MTTVWNPAQYEKFKAERSKPFFDLLSLIRPGEFNSAVDLGCGTGELTRELFERLHPKEMTGIDSSKEMLEKSAGTESPGLRFELKEIADYSPEAPLDLVFSNATLHWVSGHESFFPRMLGWIRKSGQVGVQMPFNFDHPSHQVARSVATRLFPDLFPPDHSVATTLSVERYAAILFENGFEDQVCRVEVYGHPMLSGREVVEWTKGSLLTAYQELLSGAEFARFVESYRRELLGIIGEGPYFYAFKRILLWGRRK